MAEHWVKERLAMGIDSGDPAHWIPVRKRIWRREQLQLAEVAVADTWWWTFSVQATGTCFPELPASLVYLLELVTEHRCQSYAAWLLDQARPEL